MTKNITILALRLLARFDEHISAQLLLVHYDQHTNDESLFHLGGGTRGFTGLHGAAFLGIARIVSTLLGMKEEDVNASDCTGMTALTWASERGHEEVIKILLKREDANPNLADTLYDRTPPSWAARRGHEDVVSMLLE